MKKLTRLLALLLCLTMVVGLFPAVAVAAADEPIRVACIGDSITYGHDPATYGMTRITNNWPTVLGQLLGDGYDVRNFGQNGITLLKSGGTPVWSTNGFTQSKEFQPNIVIIMLGTNDSPPETGWNKGDEFRADLKELIETYRALDSKPTVYIATCATAFGNGGFGLPPASIHNNIVPLQKEIAEEMGCPVLDVHAATADLGAHFPDNIHPDEEGHKAIAQYIYEVLNSDDPGEKEPVSPIPIYEDTSYSFEERAADLIARMTLQQKASQLVEGAAAIKASQLGTGALGVPATKDVSVYSWWSEALHGFLRDNMNPQSEGTKDNVSYAQSLTMGSTWNPDLYYEGAVAISDEIRERTLKNSLGNAINLNFYSPTVNMQRDPRWGRNEEAYSEDVLLNSVMGSMFVLGMEGKDKDGNMLDPNGYYKTLTTIKHYTANNTEAIRTNGGATTDLRALREYFTAPYRNVIQRADVRSVMTAYSSLNGEPCSYSSYLMDTLLRQTFGFSGYITSDCDSAKTISNLNYTNPRTGKKLTGVEQMAGALAHGEDLECNSGISASVGDYKAQASSMVSSNVQTDKGTFTENSIDVSAHRLMTARIATGEFDEDNNYTKEANERMAEQKANGTNNYTPERIAIVDREVEEGVVMLKNDNLLPLSIPATGTYKVAVVGKWQTDMYLGLYSSEQRHSEDEKWRINIQEGITEAFKAVNPNTTFTYITSNSLTDANKTDIQNADVAIVVTGTGNGYSAEGRDRSNISLPDNQASLISTVGQLNAKTVAIMETCGPMEVKTFQNDVKAILWSSFGGIRKGIGFGKVLTGAVNPSGHLTATWYADNNDIPGIRDYNMYATNGSNGRTYMYYKGPAPSYPFGYGLSYTTFAYSNLKIDKTAYDAHDTVKVTFDVKNTGSVTGKEVTQLYIAQPDAPAELNRPIRRLEGFEKVELKPGETKTISMEVKIPDLAFYSEANDCYEVDTGKYQVQVGEDSAHANLTKDFTVSGKLDEYPTILTVKANQVGDDAFGIEERIMFDKGATINPQLTVAMNNEKLYGYIIKEQTSIIKSLKSTALPEGMKFTYESNRPSVVKVDGDTIKAVGPGVATVTVTGTLDGHTVTADFVAYVDVNTSLTDLTVDGTTIKGFKPEKHDYKVTLEANAKNPVVAATANEGLEVKVTQVTSLPGDAVVVCTDPESGVSETYTISFKKKAANISSTFIDFTTAADSSKYEIVGQLNAAVKEGDGLLLTSTRNAIEDCNGQNTGDNANTPEDLITVPVSGDWTATLEFTFSKGSAANGYYAFFGMYASQGDDYQNMAGIRGGDGALQNFLRENGAITADSPDLNSAPGFESDGDTWYRIIKEGTTYICQRSDDGVDFTDMFTYENTSVDADNLVIDAYTGMTAGFQFNLKSLNIETVGGGGLPNIDFTTEADSDKYEIVGQTSAKVAEGVGLALVTTKTGIEPGNGQLSGDAATTPVDMVAVPVSGDNWTATIEVDFSANGAANGYYQFFGFYASMGDDYQNMAGIRGGDGAMQNFIRKNGSIEADTDGVKSAPGFANEATYYLQIAKEGTTYTCLRSEDGVDFTEMFSYEDTGIEADQLLIDAYTGMTEGYKFTLKSLTFEGGGSTPTTPAKPEISEITIDGKTFGFDPATKIYNNKVDKTSTKAPVIAATAGNKDTTIEIQQLEGPFGTAVVTATAGKKSVTYSISFNYGPEDDYFADGDMNDNWEILNEAKEPTADRPWIGYRFEPGLGLVMPTQKASIYKADKNKYDPAGWTNVFLMPAQGDWDVVVKAFYPQLPRDIYQQTQVFAWQDEDNYIRINCQYNAQTNLRVEPANEHGSANFDILDVTYAKPNEDNTATLYYKIRKKGTTYTVSYSNDCKNWIMGGTVENLDYVNPKFGLFITQDNTNNNYMDLAFEYVAVTSVDGIEQRSDTQVLEWAAQQAADYLVKSLPETTDKDLTVKAPHGYTVEFQSSKPDVIAADGKVTQSAKEQTVEVSVKVTEGDVVATSEPVTVKVSAGSVQCEHSWGTGVVTKAATCAEEGVRTYTCSKCGETKTETIAKLTTHTWDKGTVTKAATCAAEGEMTYKCTVCGETRIEKIAKTTDHKFDGGRVTKKATCKDEGVTTYTCTVCGATKTEAIPKTTDHVFGVGVTVKPATCAEEGVMTYTCSICGTTKTETIPKTDKHQFKDGKCTVCGAEDPDFVSGAELIKKYTDAPKEGNWAYDGICYCLEKGIMNGVSDTLFNPNGSLTRAQLVTILHRIMGEPKAEKAAAYTDVAADMWYTEAVAWAAENEIVTGYPDGTFKPMNKITREQIATILYRFMGSPEVKGDALADFPDKATVSAYAVDALNWAVTNGFINGIESKGVTNLAPKGTATRAQIAAIIMRFVEKTSVVVPNSHDHKV